VWPTGAQVRRVTGNSEAPDSSQNTIAARRRRAPARIRGPVLGHPASNRPLVTLDRAASRALQPVAQPVAQQLPHLAGMVADPGEPLDHGRDPGEGPMVGVEAVRAGTLPERLVDGGKLGVGQARGGPGRAGAAQPSSPPWRQRAGQRLTFWRATPRVRATSAWEWPAATSAPACLPTPSKAWRSPRPRALRREAVGLMPPDCRDNPGHVIRRGEPLLTPPTNRHQ
jgi:hypothetical protein